MPTQLKERFASLQGEVQEQLELAVVDSYPSEIHEAIKYSLLAPGKHLRPTLCLVTASIFGADKSVAMPTAVGIEMIHVATLIHDDLPIMDNDDMRRGKLSNHIVYGSDIALLAGDALLALSIEHIVKHTKGVDENTILSVVKKLLHTVGVSGLAGGQALDLLSQNAISIDLATLDSIHTRKTAALIETAITTGAMLAHVNLSEIELLTHYANNIGLAYQIVDDILDETATEAELGKPPGSDSANNKWTYPRHLGIDASWARARSLVEEAKDYLLGLGDRTILLRDLADFVVERQS